MNNNNNNMLWATNQAGAGWQLMWQWRIINNERSKYQYIKVYEWHQPGAGCDRARSAQQINQPITMMAMQSMTNSPADNKSRHLIRQRQTARNLSSPG